MLHNWLSSSCRNSLHLSFITSNNVLRQPLKPEWSFLTEHGQALLRVAQDPECRLRDIVEYTGITERRVHGILNDLVESGYVRKAKVGRRNRYDVSVQMPTPEIKSRSQSIGDVLALLNGPRPTTN